MIIHEGDQNGEFAMWLYEREDQNEEQPTRIVHYVNETQMEEDAERLKKGGRYVRIWIGGYDEESDSWSNEIDDWRKGDD